MDRKNNLLVDSQKPQWDWLTVECVLRTSEDGKKNSIWQLAPSIFLTNPTSSGSDPNVKLFIDTEKSLNYSPELGWNWHKSWNLPNISVKLEIKDQAGEQLLSPKNLYAQIFAVKKTSDNEINDKMTLLDVGIRGESKMEMIDGHVYFSAMKFSSTTYNNEGHNFHLLIVIYIHENSVEKPKVLTAVISPEIFVDSRRAARDYQERKFNSFVEPFNLDHIDKEFVKRENKSKIEQETVIGNDPEGFYNYLTAPNIRHKVKHPLFLAIRFSNCVSIFFNKSAFSIKQNEKDDMKLLKDIFEALQKKLLKECQGKLKQQVQKGSVNDKMFLFVVENLKDSLKRKKIMESLESLSSPSIQVVEDMKETPNNFAKIQSLGNLVQGYKQVYETLKQMCRKYLPFEGSSSDQESPDDLAPKKMKVSKFQGGVAYSCNSTRKRRQANIVCKTIHTKDIPKVSQIQANSVSQPQKESIKKQNMKQQQQKNMFQAQQNQPSQQNNNQFSLSLGKGSAFNNIRKEKPQQEHFNEGFAQFSGNTGLPNQNFGFPANGMNFNGFGMNNNFLGSMGGLNNLSGMNGMGINPLSLMGMNSYQNLASNLNSNLNNLGNLGGLSNMNMNLLNNLANQNNPKPLNSSSLNEREQKNTIDNILCSNMMLSEWLNSVKTNNRSLSEAISGQQNHRLDEALKQGNTELLNQNLAQNQDQSSLYLYQQINLYRELLNQITYQNELLGRNLAQNRGDSDSSRLPQDGNMNPQFSHNTSFLNNGMNKPKQQPK